MANINNLTRQHIEILEMIYNIRELMNKDLEEESSEIAKNINLLSGKLKIHLESEDKFLYPNLLKNENEKIKNIAKCYIDEMGDIFNIFNNYKNQFNTRSKIINNKDNFVINTKEVFDKIEKRMKKEDKELYTLLQDI
ncbi:MAG: hemerythrin domain-containing protein [Clostridium argentinense]|uniref:Hemerythrin domain-containing protein n=1 Tax=Clostridium faecium TaxID=2762223 RepID=A0ABR8YMT1_9CLOT|nr:MULTISPECIES: hemerythrin domain-containing protein [Clostridium]MBD8045556.1 hemerythrin domain-containing protein [Clostridium faecium]MBS5825272.1 hemerythrin domain-containing protein [Clostridium argentinense]MDU1350333.1 hemerythrin domain-containing protein [Clostridium argentinense]